MKRTKIKNAAELKRLTVTEAKNTFLQHCKVKNLSESTLGYYKEDIENLFLLSVANVAINVLLAALGVFSLGGIFY